MTHPMGTSPDFPAFSAVLSAKSMKEGAVLARIIARNLIVAAPSAKVASDFARDAARRTSAQECPLITFSETFHAPQ
jgi:hypothetical protein